MKIKCLNFVDSFLMFGLPAVSEHLLTVEPVEDILSQWILENMKWRNIGPDRGGRSLAVSGSSCASFSRQDPITAHTGNCGSSSTSVSPTHTVVEDEAARTFAEAFYDTIGEALELTGLPVVASVGRVVGATLVAVDRRRPPRCRAA